MKACRGGRLAPCLCMAAGQVSIERNSLKRMAWPLVGRGEVTGQHSVWTVPKTRQRWAGMGRQIFRAKESVAKPSRREMKCRLVMFPLSPHLLRVNNSDEWPHVGQGTREKTERARGAP